MIIACQSLGSRPILVLELFTLVPLLFGTTSRGLSVQPVQLLPSRNIWRHISLTWPFPHWYRHSPWPVDVTELFPRFCCCTLIWLSRHWAWLHRGYWRYRSSIDWLIEVYLTSVYYDIHVFSQHFYSAADVKQIPIFFYFAAGRSQFCSVREPMGAWQPYQNIGEAQHQNVSYSFNNLPILIIFYFWNLQPISLLQYAHFISTNECKKNFSVVVWPNVANFKGICGCGSYRFLGHVSYVRDVQQYVLSVIQQSVCCVPCCMEA